MNWNNSGYTLEINGAGSWKLYRIGTQIASGTVTKNAEGKYNLKLVGLGDTVYAYIDGNKVTSYTDANPMLSGRVKISSNWTQVYADNLEIKTVKGGILYATAMIDGQDDGVAYNGTWAINNPGGGSADNWYRTMSVSSTAGSSFTFTVDGSGFAIMGGNDGSAVIDVYVDGELKAENASTKAAPTRGEAYIMSALTAGKHTIKIVLKSGTLNVDALNTIGERLAGCGRRCDRDSDRAAHAGVLRDRQRRGRPASPRSRSSWPGRHPPETKSAGVERRHQRTDANAGKDRFHQRHREARRQRAGRAPDRQRSDHRGHPRRHRLLY
ncbi:MAG: hypothetical protein ACLRYE_03855 [Gemmiger formicilis]|uniref:hypothetical protein n=1 Tax=Gemmiger formicilis TaxID=745368 RepID=UPI0039A218EE